MDSNEIGKTTAGSKILGDGLSFVQDIAERDGDGRGVLEEIPEILVLENERNIS